MSVGSERLVFRAPPELLAAIDREAMETESNRSGVVRWILTRYFDRKKSQALAELADLDQE